MIQTTKIDEPLRAAVERGDVPVEVAMAAMQLVEQGKLTLDRPIADVLPEVSAPQVLTGFSPSGEPQLRPAKGSITLRHLLTHTSGFVYDIWNAEMGRYMETKGIPGIISCQNAALALPLVFDPGDRWDYGIGIDWAGKAIERVSRSSVIISTSTC